MNIDTMFSHHKARSCMQLLYCLKMSPENTTNTQERRDGGKKEPVRYAL